MSCLPTNNTAWGFWGTIGHEADTATAWRMAMPAIAQATGCPETTVRDFLDSRHGRHLADDVSNGLASGLGLEQAILAAVERWMGWRISRRISHVTGIPQGLPYLAGFVLHAAIEAEVEAEAA